MEMESQQRKSTDSGSQDSEKRLKLLPSDEDVKDNSPPIKKKGKSFSIVVD